MGTLEEKEKIFKYCRVIGATMCISGMFLTALQSDTIVGLVFGYICYIGIFLYITARIFEWRLKKAKDKMMENDFGTLKKTLDKSTTEGLVSVLEKNDFEDEPADTIQDEPIILQEEDLELAPEQKSKSTLSIEKPKKPHFTLNHWSVGIVLLGILCACSPTLESFGVGLAAFGVGLFVASMNRKWWLAIPFFFIFLGAAIHNCTYNPSLVSYRHRSCNAVAESDVYNAYKTAMAYFADYPNGTVTLPKLTSYGYVQSKGVNLSILSGRKSDLKITSAHSYGSKTYTVNSNGEISF